jgi:hypothetical protein
MARRPDLRARDEILTEHELQELQHRLSRLSAWGVDFYHRAHRECCLHEKKLPSARAIQELVTAWKRLRKGR